MIYPCLYQTSSGTPRNLDTLLALRSQGFGENYQWYHDNLGTNGHAGMDWPCSVGTPIYAAVAGRVSYVATDFHVESGGGAGIVIENSEGECTEWHFSRVDVKIGDMVAVGQQVGLSGDTGFSTGPHVHLEWRPHPLAYNNGFYGSVDFTALMQWRPLSVGERPMTEDEVKKLYVLAFYREPDVTERAYWVGKTLADFLAVAIKDRAVFLSQHQ